MRTYGAAREAARAHNTPAARNSTGHERDVGQRRSGSQTAAPGRAFVTCLVDIIRPTVGFAAVKLLEDAGCKVVVPSQTCCGQPAYNSGDRATAKALAEQAIAAFEDCDYVVAPSGSCGGMLAIHYPDLFAGEPELAAKADALPRRRTSW